MRVIFDIEDSCVKYHIELDRRISFVVGDSATGKTTLVELINNQLNDNSIKLKSNINVIPSTLLSWQNDIKTYKDTLIIIDDLEVVSTSLFASLVSQYCIENNLYFLIMSREDADDLLGAHKLSYSTNSIFRLAVLEGTHVLLPYYELGDSNTSGRYDLCIVEDEGAGFDFYTNMLSNMLVVSSRGKGNITDKVIEYVNKGYRNILVIFDTASFGCHMAEFIREIDSRDCNVAIVSTYECFEELLIRSNIINHLEEVNTVLSDLPEYANTFVSWENYFEYWLEKLTEGKQYFQKHQRRPSQLNDCYKVDCGKKGKNKDGYVCRNMCDIFLEGNKFEEMLKGTKYEFMLKYRESAKF